MREHLRHEKVNPYAFVLAAARDPGVACRFDPGAGGLHPRHFGGRVIGWRLVCALTGVSHEDSHACRWSDRHRHAVR